MSFFSRIKYAFGIGDIPMEQSALTPSQVYGYYQSTGDASIYDIYGAGDTGFRNRALSLSTLFRAVTVTSSVLAQLLKNRSALQVVDEEDNVIKGDSEVDNVLGLLRRSPDGILSSRLWLEDFVAEYLLDGNAIFSINRVGNKIVSLEHLLGHSAELDYTRRGDQVYHAHYFYPRGRTSYKTVPGANVSHCRWPILARRMDGSSNRAEFANSPVALMRPAISIGLESDKYILEWYKNDVPKSNLGISVPGKLEVQQMKDWREALAENVARRAPLIFGQNARFTNLGNSSQNKDQANLRDGQINEICRIYGIPGPIVGQNVTQWGSGIENLARLFWKYGLKQHMERILDPLEFKLFSPGKYFKINEAEIIRGDSVSIAQMVVAAQGVANQFEKRNWMGLPREPEYGELPDEMPSNVDNQPPPGNNSNGADEDNE